MVSGARFFNRTTMRRDGCSVQPIAPRVYALNSELLVQVENFDETHARGVTHTAHLRRVPTRRESEDEG